MSLKFVDYTSRDGKGKIEDISDCIHFQDRLDVAVNRRMEWDMMAYMPFSLMNFYRLFSSAKRVNLQYPKQDYENFVAQKENQGLLDNLWDGLDLNFKRSWSTKSQFLLEGLSYLLRIITPDIKGVLPAVL